MRANALKLAVVAGLGLTTLTGCMGQMATTGLVSKFNLEVVDNRNARAGMFILLSPVYGIAGAADLFIFNTVEFWTGTNPISGKSPAVVDTPTKNYIKVNDQLDDSLKSVPLSNNRNIEHATLQQIDETTMQMDISYLDGTQQSLRGEKTEDSVAFYLDNHYVTTVTTEELTDYLVSTRV
ncbi:DUF3332 domain-containing protein [Vibrio sp. JPW-9-11-11]|uniref:DUF3332 domain-containing protein n=1 Tax=Vibrio sp. JPW-9-11-11 TaxID=1416532 RepID=UPI001594000E|nr:DUF3332 domain-containing protein [Vibrio sp. JPW-9-11-11]NVD09012.1 DUF3332 domain-containing protein [Vibrio sp. JPW-9-11-11]